MELKLILLGYNMTGNMFIKPEENVPLPDLFSMLAHIPMLYFIKELN